MTARTLGSLSRAGALLAALLCGCPAEPVAPPPPPPTPGPPVLLACGLGLRETPLGWKVASRAEGGDCALELKSIEPDKGHGRVELKATIKPVPLDVSRDVWSDILRDEIRETYSTAVTGDVEPATVAGVPGYAMAFQAPVCIGVLGQCQGRHVLVFPPGQVLRGTVVVVNGSAPAPGTSVLEAVRLDVGPAAPAPPAATNPPPSVAAPTGADALALERASAMIEAGKASAAIETLERLSRAHPRSRDVFYELGRARMRTQEWALAHRAFQSAIGTDPGFKDGYYNLAIVLTRLGKRKEALDAYSKALALDPADAGVLNNMGDLEFKARNFGAALGWFEKATEVNPSLADPYFNLGMTLIEMKGDATRIRTSLQRYLELAPADAPQRAKATQLLRSNR